MAIDTPARHIYSGDGSTRVFPIPTYIQGDDYIRIEINGLHQVDRSKWDIVNNSIIFVTAPISESTIDVQVATSVEALAELGSITNIDIVADSIADINDIASNLDEILLANDNAIIAKEEAWRAEAERLTANSYANEPEDVYVKIYTSNNDGTFTITNTADYSSYHWERKATTLIIVGIIDDVTSSDDKTYSSNKIDGIVNTIEGNIDTIEGNIDTIEGNIDTIEGNIDTIEGNISTLNNTTVKLTGNQTVAGIKTFTSSPIIPTPTTAFQAATKQYIDDALVEQLGTDNLFMIQDQKASGTNGDTLTLNAWKKLTKNTVIVNNIGVVVSSSVLTMLSGTYYFESEEPFGVINPTVQASFKTRLRNISDSTTLAAGGSFVTKSDAATNEVRSGFIKMQGLFTLSSSKNIEIEAYNSGVVGTSGFGLSASGEIEVYGTLKIWKVG